MLCDEQIEQLEELKKALPQPAPPRARRKRRHRSRALAPTEVLGGSAAQRRRLANQSTAGHRGAMFPPGEAVSVELAQCGHRARVEVLTSGLLPRRAKCPRCRLWRNTLPGTARKPVRPATRTVIAERDEVRDGRVFVVKVLGTPRRARF